MRRALLLILLLASPALADKAPHKEGDYGGVIPGQKAEPGAKPGKTKRPPSKGTLSWIGFEAKDGGAQLFFQSVAAFDVSQHVEGSTLIVHLMLPRRAANAWRQVDTRFFENPLSGVVAKAVGAAKASKAGPAHPAGVQVRITFKNPKDAREGSLTTKTEADGRYYAYLSFPPGTPGPTTTTTTTPTQGDPEN